MSEWIEVTDDQTTWPTIGEVILAKGSVPYYSFGGYGGFRFRLCVLLLCVEELDSGYPQTHISWKVPHNIRENADDTIDYECSSTHTGNVTHWKPI